MVEVEEKVSFQEFSALSQANDVLEAPLTFEDWNPKLVEAYLHDPREDRLKNLLEEIARQETVLNDKQETLEAYEKKLASVQEDIEKERQGLEEERQEIVQKQNEVVQQIELFKKVIGHVEDIKKGSWANHRSELVDFALALSERVILKEIKEDPACLLGQLSSAIEQAQSEDTVIVHMCPDQLALLKESDHSEIKKLLSSTKVRWNGNLKLEPGQIYVDAEQYRLDASVMIALKNIREDLRAGLEEETTLDQDRSTEDFYQGDAAVEKVIEENDSIASDALGDEDKE